jgi:hypothetical protein
MDVKHLVRFIALFLILGMSPDARTDDGSSAAPKGNGASRVDVATRSLGWIKPGTVIGNGPPAGWTHLVLFAKPRIGVGDVDAIPRSATRYAGMFSFVIVANVVPESNSDGAEPRYYLQRLAIGTATNVKGRNIIVTSEQTFGADVGFIGRTVMQENEKMIRNDLRQVARTRTMSVFDANAIMLRDNRHTTMVMRHVILVAPQTGHLTSFVWLLNRDGQNKYAPAEKAVQLLPAQMMEDRVLSVDSDKFTLGIPAVDAFALARIPQGMPIKYSPSLSSLAAIRQFTPESTRQLEAELQESYAPLASRAQSSTSVRR